MAIDIKEQKLILSQAPHIHSKHSTSGVMWIVFIALMPAAINAVRIFKLNALIIIIASILSALLAEFLIRVVLKRNFTLANGSAAVTGLLIAMNVPPNLPWWMAPIGSFFAIIIVKELFGGLGYNIFNPALAARAFLMASWTTEMTTKWYDFSGGTILSARLNQVSGAVDAVSGATPLYALRIAKSAGSASNDLYNTLFSTPMLKSLAWGDIGGCIGETSAIMLLIGGLFLIIIGIVKWQIPFSYIGTFSAIILFYYYITGFNMPLNALVYHLLSGGLFLGAFFMATDMVTSPMTAKGMFIFGAGCGIITAIIRLFGGYPEGVSYSILLMNAVVPLIDRYTKPKIFGAMKSNGGK